MDSWIYGAGVFALAVIAAFLLLSEHRAAEKAEEPAPFKWGQAQRHYVREEVHWACSHEFLLAVTAICVYAAIVALGAT